MLWVLGQALQLEASPIGTELKAITYLNLAAIELAVLLLAIVVGLVNRSILMCQRYGPWLYDNTLRACRVILTVLERSIIETHRVLLIRRIHCIVYRSFKAVFTS